MAAAARVLFDPFMFIWNLLAVEWQILSEVFVSIPGRYSSMTTWKFVPPNPKELIRLVSHHPDSLPRIVFEYSHRKECLKNRYLDSVVSKLPKLEECGGITPKMVFSIPTAPAAALQMTKLDFTDPRATVAGFQPISGKNCVQTADFSHISHFGGSAMSFNQPDSRR